MLSHDKNSKILKQSIFSSKYTTKSPKHQSLSSNKSYNNSQNVNNYFSNISYDSNSNLQIEKLTKELLKIINMRLTLENLIKPDEKEIKSLIVENLRFIDLKHFDVKNLNILVDDLIEIIKKEILLKQDSNDEIEDSSGNYFDKYIDFTKSIYRPQPIVPDELKNLNDQFEHSNLFFQYNYLALRKNSKQNETSKIPLKFNLYTKNKKEEKIFHKVNKMEFDVTKIQNEFIEKEMERGKKKFYNF